ncbi:MAG: restriction endonuclease subunit S [Bacteroidaceae bacterium]|nr:restriction endonuclease subunit S [Bacteroidaceae bacterium]
MREGWEIEKLGEYISEYSVRDKGKGYPVYSVTNSQGFCKEFFGKNVASEDTSNYKVVPKGCFAYNPSRINVGSVDCQDKEEYVSVSPLYVVFKVSPELSQKYLLYYLKSDSCMTFIKAYSRGAVRNNLRLSQLGDFEIPIPPLSIQQSIVSELDMLSGLIAKHEEQLKAYDELAQSIFYDMFGDPVENEKGWEVKKLGEVAKEKLSYGSGASAKQYDGKVRYVRITDIKDDGELNTDMVSPDTYDEKWPIAQIYS